MFTSPFVGLECYTLIKLDLSSLDFVITRVLMKLFKSTNINLKLRSHRTRGVASRLRASKSVRATTFGYYMHIT